MSESIELTRDRWESLVTAAIELNLIRVGEDARPDYTGRDMWTGDEEKDTCVAFIIDDDNDILNFGYNLDQLLRRARIDDLNAEPFTSNCRSDSHGSSAVIYFPRISVEALAPIDTDEGEDDDEDGNE